MSGIMFGIAFLSFIFLTTQTNRIIFRALTHKDIDSGLKTWYYGCLGVMWVAISLAVGVHDHNWPQTFVGLALGAFCFLVSLLLQMLYLKIRSLPIDAALKKSAIISLMTMIFIYPLGSTFEPESWAEVRLAKEAEQEAKKEAALDKKIAELEAEDKAFFDKEYEESIGNGYAPVDAKNWAMNQLEENKEAKKKAAEQAAKKAAAQAKEQAAAEKKQQEAAAKAAETKATEQTAAEKKQQAETKKPAAAASTQSAPKEDDGIWGSIKSYVGKKVDGVTEYAGGLVSNEVHACDLTNDKTNETLSYYFVPSSKKRKDGGIIFKDEGYVIDVLLKVDGKTLISKRYWFVERNDDWEWSENDGKDWFRIKSQYSEMEKKFGLEVGKAIWDGSHRLPNLGVAD